MDIVPVRLDILSYNADLLETLTVWVSRVPVKNEKLLITGTRWVIVDVVTHICSPSGGSPVAIVTGYLDA